MLISKRGRSNFLKEDAKGFLNIKQEVFKKLSLTAPEIVTLQPPEMSLL